MLMVDVELFKSLSKIFQQEYKQDSLRHQQVKIGTLNKPQKQHMASVEVPVAVLEISFN